MATITVQKQADIRYRVALKQHPGIVVYMVRSSTDKEDYQVTFVDGKANNCTCPARKPCYHMRDCQSREDARFEDAHKRARAREDELRSAYNRFALSMGF